MVSGQWGVQWQVDYWQRIKPINASLAMALRPDGKAFYFSLKNGAWSTDADTNERLTKIATGWQLITEDRSIETYDASGLLLSITDHANRQQVLAYSDGTAGVNGGFVLDDGGNATSLPLAAGLLIRVKDDTGRSLGFGYNSQSQVVKMTDPANKPYLYAYDASGNLLSVIYPDAKKRTYIYNELANTSGVDMPNALTGIVDENNKRFATYQYDAGGRAMSSGHAGNAEKIMLAYASTSSSEITATTVTDSFNTSRNYSFTTVAGAVRNTAISQPAGAGSAATSSTMTYDANGNIASRTDFNGHITRYTYDLARNLERSRTEAYGTAEARTITTLWHATFRLPTQIIEPGKRTDFDYDARGNLLSRTVTDTTTNISRKWSYTYNARGQVLTIDGPRTDVADITTYTYYESNSAGNYTLGDLASVKNALGHLTSITKYDASGRPLSITDANGVITLLAYDLRGRLIAKQVGAQKTTYSYSGSGQLTRITFPDGNYLAYSYDAAQRLTDIIDRSNSKIHFTLDTLNNIVKQETKDSASVITTIHARAFDALNRLQKDIGGTNPAETLQYAYDNNGNLTSVVDALNRSVTRSYDALDRLVQMVDPANGTTRQTHDGLDHLTQVSDPRQLATLYSRNAFGDITRLQSPDSGISNFAYDTAGNPIQQTDARGIVTKYVYDALNRLTAIQYPASTAENVSFTYDSTGNGNKGIGRLTGYSNEGGATVLTYDVYGNVTLQTEMIGAQICTTAYQYDSANRIKQITYPSGRIVLYTRDILGQVTQVQLKENSAATAVTLATGATYRPFGPLKTLTLGNGITTTAQYDADERIARISTTSTPLWDFVYSYDLANQLTKQADQLSSFSRLYNYDALARVISDSNNIGSWTYQYDAVGNRLKRTGSAQTLMYATTSNRLVKNGSTILTFDAAGNLTINGTQSYTYNNANRLSLYKVSNTVKAQLRYNALGQRTQKIQIAKPVNFHYGLNQQLLGESAFNADNTLYQRTDWIYLDALPIAQIKTSYGANNAITGTRLTYIHTDHLGTPRLMTDSTKKIVWRWDGDAFGQTPPNQNPDSDATTDTLNLRFPGQYADVESGLYYNLNRYYDPTIGRYTQSDPIGLRGGLNTYGYVNGNPVSFIDPLGLASCSYSISTHTLSCIPNAGGDPLTLGPGGVWSGVGTCANKSSCENIPDLGPIVEGKYNMNEDDRPGHEGFWRLEPNPKIPGWECRLHWNGIRCGFELHPGGTSLGCITADKKNAAVMKQYGGINKLLTNENGKNSLTVTP